MLALDALQQAHAQSAWKGWSHISDRDQATLDALFAEVAWCTQEAISGIAPFAKPGFARSNKMCGWLDTVGVLDEELQNSLGMTQDPGDYDERLSLSGIGKLPNGNYLIVCYQGGFGGGCYNVMMVVAEHPALAIITKRWAARMKELEMFITRMTEAGMLEGELPFAASRPF